MAITMVRAMSMVRNITIGSTMTMVNPVSSQQKQRRIHQKHGKKLFVGSHLSSIKLGVTMLHKELKQIWNHGSKSRRVPNDTHESFETHIRCASKIAQRKGEEILKFR